MDEETGMQELRKAALTYYNSQHEKQQKLFKDFFKALDTNGDGSVSLIEFLEFLREAGIYDGNDPTKMFKMFDRDGNGVLDYEEVITIFYYLYIGPGAQYRASGKPYIKEGKWKKTHKALEAFAVGASLGQVIGGVAVVTGFCCIM